MNKPLTLDGYQAKARETAIYPGKHTLAGMAYAMAGLAGEVGESNNQWQKALRGDDGKPDALIEATKWGRHSTHSLTPERILKIADEIGGSLWFMAAACDELGVSLEVIAARNLAKLAKRKQDGTIKGDGDDR